MRNLGKKAPLIALVLVGIFVGGIVAQHYGVLSVFTNFAAPTPEQTYYYDGDQPITIIQQYEFFTVATTFDGGTGEVNVEITVTTVIELSVEGFTLLSAEATITMFDSSSGSEIIYPKSLIPDTPLSNGGTSTIVSLWTPTQIGDYTIEVRISDIFWS